MFEKALKEIIKSYPCPFGDSPLKEDGQPTKAMVEWMVIRLSRVEIELDMALKMMDIMAMRESKRAKKLKRV